MRRVALAGWFVRTCAVSLATRADASPPFPDMGSAAKLDLTDARSGQPLMPRLRGKSDPHFVYRIDWPRDVSDDRSNVRVVRATATNAFGRASRCDGPRHRRSDDRHGPETACICARLFSARRRHRIHDGIDVRFKRGTNVDPDHTAVTYLIDPQWHVRYEFWAALCCLDHCSIDRSFLTIDDTMSRWRTPLGVRLVASVVAAATFGHHAFGKPDRAATQMSAISNVRTLTDIRVRRLTGEPTSLLSYRGKPLWLNFFATWCPPCNNEMPEIERHYRGDAKAGLVVLGLDQHESAEPVRNFVRSRDVTFPTMLDDGDASTAFAVNALRVSVFIDRSRTVRQIRFGEMSSADIDESLARIL